MTSGNVKDESIYKVFMEAVLSWFNERADVKQKDIFKCCGGTRFSKIGHFLQVIQDKVTSVGCAASRYTKNGSRHTLVTCNYSHPNVINFPVYEIGSPASKCPSGREMIYINLCKSIKKYEFV